MQEIKEEESGFPEEDIKDDETEDDSGFIEEDEDGFEGILNNEILDHALNLPEGLLGKNKNGD